MRWAVIVVLLGVTGCRGGQIDDDDLNLIRHDALVAMLEADDRVVLVDVRDSASYRAGHLPGAIHIPVIEMRSADLRLTGAKDIVVYSSGWTAAREDPLSWAGGKKLLTLGYRRVHDYRGGVARWTENGGELVQAGE